MVDDKPLDTRSTRLEMTAPWDERFRTVLSSLCERMARYVGYLETDAGELASSVVHATDGEHPVVGIERRLGRQRGNDVPIDLIRAWWSASSSFKTVASNSACWR